MILFVKNLVFTLVVPGTVAGYIPLFLFGGEPSSNRLLIGLSILLGAVGIAAYCWCVWDFASRGLGTPAPIDAPKKLVTRGLYSYSRNPMYVAVACVILGWASFFAAWNLFLYAVGIGLAFHLRVVLHEEPHLEAVFGEEYRAYCLRTSRWIPTMGTPAA